MCRLNGSVPPRSARGGAAHIGMQRVPRGAREVDWPSLRRANAWVLGTDAPASAYLHSYTRAVLLSEHTAAVWLRAVQWAQARGRLGGGSSSSCHHLRLSGCGGWQARGPACARELCTRPLGCARSKSGGSAHTHPPTSQLHARHEGLVDGVGELLALHVAHQMDLRGARSRGGGRRRRRRTKEVRTLSA